MAAHLAAHQLALTIEPDTARLGELRGELRRWLTEHGQESSDWGLIATELCTNSMAVTVEPIHLTMSLGETEAVLEVTDDGPGFELSVLNPGVTSSRRRGLWIVEQLTDRLEVVVRGGTTTVIAARAITSAEQPDD